MEGADNKFTIALIYDFDGTLAAGNMQEYDFIPAVGKSNVEFWNEANHLAEMQDADQILTYMAVMIREAQAICVGGGNTFALAKKMQEQGLMTAILRKIKQGTPYVGWSAGSNVCCPTIYTTNDMPIVEPESFKAIGAVKFQINPHYLDANPEGHAGETREQRIEEYIEANPRRYVVGLREGCMLRYVDGKLELIGSRPMRIFKKGITAYEVQAGDDLSFLL